MLPEQEREEEERRKAQYAQDLKTLESYASEPALGLSHEVRYRLSRDAPDRLRDIEDRLRVELAAAEAMQMAEIARTQATNRAQGERILQALRVATREQVPALVECYAEARRRGEIDADTAGTLAQTLAQTIGRALGTVVLQPDLAGAVHTLCSLVAGRTAEAAPAALERLVVRLEEILVRRSGSKMETVFTGEVSAEALAEWLRQTGERALSRGLAKNATSGAMPVQTYMGTEGAAARSQPLPEAIRVSLEQSFGESLTEVRVHSGSLQGMGGVPAVAAGKDVHMAEGEAGLETEADRKILRHEVAHVVQQSGRGGMVPRGLGAEGERRLLEADAERAAEAAAAGDRAEVRWRAPRGRPQGFEPCEHRAIAREGGSGRKIRLDCGLEVAYEDVVWMAGDLYGSAEALKKAPKKEVLALLEIGGRQESYARRARGSISPEKQAEIDAAFQDATAERERTYYEDHKASGTEGAVFGGDELSYQEEAKTNHEHFAGENLKKWQNAHERAKNAAAHAFADRSRRHEHLNEALLHEAFGAHFLTDAFAAGHLVDGTQGREWAEEIIVAEYGALRDSILWAAEQDLTFFDEVPGRPAMGRELWQLIVNTAFSVGVGLAHGSKDALASLLLKVVHDELNQTGSLVRNQRGDEWLATGDLNLWRSPKTQVLAAEAVRVGREELESLALGKVWRGTSPRRLVPSMVSHGGKWWSLDQFRKNREVFLSILRPLVFTSSPVPNRLYRMIRGNMLPVAKSKAKEFAIGTARAVGHGIPRAFDVMLGADVKNQGTDPGVSGAEPPDGGVP